MEIIKFLKEKKANIKAKDIYGRVYLITTSKTTKWKEINFFAENKIDFNECDNYHRNSAFCLS
jgi:hypothetical protein